MFEVIFKLLSGLSWLIEKAFWIFVVIVFALAFIGPIGWIKMGLLVECKYVEKCAKEHNIEYVERKK